MIKNYNLPFFRLILKQSLKHAVKTEPDQVMISVACQDVSGSGYSATRNWGASFRANTVLHFPVGRPLNRRLGKAGNLARTYTAPS